jgi:hypothetical protein
MLLRNRRTRLYYVGSRRPGVGLEQALDCGDVPGATKFALEQRLQDMEIVLRYDTRGGEVPLPVLPEWWLFDKQALRPVRFSTLTVLPPALTL